ncbi:MAG TPA: histidinol dehydrogenase [Firmicutes bacterium]|nr:histidinol dehydrogenase [Bacillota bacterium]
MRILSAPEFREGLSSWRGGGVLGSIEDEIRPVIADVFARGDDAVIDYTLKFDGAPVTRETMTVSRAEIEAARARLPGHLLRALVFASERIRAFHELQKARSLVTTLPDGTLLGRIYRPLRRVGVYVPGGKATYPSSVLMNCIPAKVAGVDEVIMCTPPSRDGSVADAVLAAADIAGVAKVIRAGGPQAIAAMARGTGVIPKVDKIVGPGGAYVTAAKRLVWGLVDIDMLAGPSEIMIIADEGANEEFIAADLVSQAEHDTLAQAILVTPSRRLGDAVLARVAELLENFERRSIAGKALEDYGAVVIVSGIDEAIELANLYAPEHLSLQVEDAFSLLGRLYNAGSIFVGPYSPVPAGDYAAGPNHVLPTGGTARFGSALGVEAFIKASNVVACSRNGLRAISEAVCTVAEAEGLVGHAAAIRARLS